MNSFSLLPSKVKIRKCSSYFSGFFITLEWHLWVIGIRVGLTGTCVGSARLFRHQHVGIGIRVGGIAQREPPTRGLSRCSGE